MTDKARVRVHLSWRGRMRRGMGAESACCGPHWAS